VFDENAASHGGAYAFVDSDGETVVRWIYSSS